MKRRDLISYLSECGCQFVREGGEHSIWENPANNRRTSIPRHREIPDFTAIRICKQLDILSPF
ncbi:MAG: type II toxin-antitoxin system HicA family toxin [Methylacidiphilales bacterium]|nr:type II toxin-antitoxin system HicA family toxin [Candidatus Methylacidiphilales bacterium]